MEVHESILKIQERSLRLAPEASVAEMKGRTGTFSLECRAGSQLLLHKDESKPKRWSPQWKLRTHLGLSGVKLRTQTLTAGEDGSRREGLGPLEPRRTNCSQRRSCSTQSLQKGSVQLGREAPAAAFLRAQSCAASAVGEHAPPACCSGARP